LNSGEEEQFLSTQEALEISRIINNYELYKSTTGQGDYTDGGFRCRGNATDGGFRSRGNATDDDKGIVDLHGRSVKDALDEVTNKLKAAKSEKRELPFNSNNKTVELCLLCRREALHNHWQRSPQ